MRKNDNEIAQNGSPSPGRHQGFFLHFLIPVKKHVSRKKRDFSINLSLKMFKINFVKKPLSPVSWRILFQEFR